MVTRSLPKGIQVKKQVKKPVNQIKMPANITPPEKNNVQEILELHSKHLLKLDEMLLTLHDELKEIKGLVVGKKNERPETSIGVVKGESDTAWHVLIEPDREYTQKEIIGITKISQPTLSMAKARGHIITRVPAGERGWVVLGSDLLTWDRGRAIHTEKKTVVNSKKKTPAKKSPVKKGTGQLVRAGTQKALVVQTPSKTSKTLTVQKKETRALATTPPSSQSVKSPAVVRKGGKSQAIPPKKVVKVQPVTKLRSESQTLIPDDIPDRINSLTLEKKLTQTQFGNEVDLPQKVIYEITSRKLKELSPVSLQKITTVLKKYESK